jgi:acetyl-CoA C-acetyltransferase
VTSEPVISGAACTVFGRFATPLVEEAATIVLAALEDAQLEPSDVGALYVGNFAAELVENQGGIAAIIAGEAGMPHVPATKVEGVCASGGIALRHAIQAVTSGSTDVAVAVAVDALLPLPRDRRIEVIASALDQRIEGRLGMSFATFFALVARSYLERHGVEQRQLFPVVAHNLERGARNPVVSRPRKLSESEYLESPYVAEPLRAADSCPTSDGAAAVVVSRATRSNGARGHFVRILACEQGSGSSSVVDLAELEGFDVVRRVAAAAYDKAGVRARDIDVVELHDAFSIAQLVDLEDLGFFERGRGLDFLGRQDRLYVNPSGGLLSRGHPIAASSLAQIYELVLQLRGQSHHQHPSPRLVMAQSVGGIGGYATVTILTGGE